MNGLHCICWRFRQTARYINDSIFSISLLELFDWTKRLLVKLLKHYIGWPSVVIAYEENGFLLNPKSFFYRLSKFLITKEIHNRVEKDGTFGRNG